MLLHEQKHRDMIKPYADDGLLGWARYWYDRNWSPTRGEAYFELPAYRAQAEFLADYGLPTATSKDLRFLFDAVEPTIEEHLSKTTQFSLTFADDASMHVARIVDRQPCAPAGIPDGP